MVCVPAYGVRGLRHPPQAGPCLHFMPPAHLSQIGRQIDKAIPLPACANSCDSHTPGPSVPEPRSSPVLCPVAARQLERRRSAWRCLGQDAWIIDPSRSASAHRNSAGWWNLHRWCTVAHHRMLHARCAVNSSRHALKAWPRLRCTCGHIVDRGHIAVADDSEPWGLIGAAALQRWRGCENHRGCKHGNQEDSRETAL
jgi:hypothetical protein